MKSNRISMGITRCMNFCAPSRASNRLDYAFFRVCAALMRQHNRCIDHRALMILILRQKFQRFFLYALLAPKGKADVDGFKITKPLLSDHAKECLHSKSKKEHQKTEDCPWLSRP
nr:hypothetical protein [Holospora obtusa]